MPLVKGLPMFPFPVKWDEIALKEGDPITLSLSPVERALLIALLINFQYIGEKAPQSMNIGDDGDNFDAVLSNIMSQLVVS